MQKFKEKLQATKKSLEEELSRFTKKDPKLKEDWDTIFPKFDGEIGGSALEVAANEVEEYESRLPIEYSLETRLKDVNLALGKIKKGKYGKCENCNKKIDENRLSVCPEARFCLKCTHLVKK
jgi:RNA polymerase-binding transcription factor DksA